MTRFVGLQLVPTSAQVTKSKSLKSQKREIFKMNIFSVSYLKRVEIRSSTIETLFNTSTYTNHIALILGDLAVIFY